MTPAQKAAATKAANKAAQNPALDPMAGLVPAGGKAPGEDPLDAPRPVVPAVSDPLAPLADVRTAQDEENLLAKIDREEKLRDAASAPVEEGDFDDLEGIEDIDVTTAPDNENLMQFENRMMAASIQQVDTIEVRPQIIMMLQRSKKLPKEGYIMYRGIKLVIKGKLDEVEAADSMTTNDKLFPRGYENTKLPEGVKGT